MEATASGTATHSYAAVESPSRTRPSSRGRAVVWLRTLAGAWGLATALVLGLSLMGQLGAEHDWLGRGMVILLLGGQCCLAVLQLSRWR